jgi:hypothetical protein
VVEVREQSRISDRCNPGRQPTAPNDAGLEGPHSNLGRPQHFTKQVAEALRHWRGIYYIFDTSDRKGYVGSAYGEHNILGRWQHYATSGHGGNILLRERSPENFIFSILQIVSHDMEVDEITTLEWTWKKRLHTMSASGGLNEN